MGPPRMRMNFLSPPATFFAYCLMKIQRKPKTSRRRGRLLYRSKTTGGISDTSRANRTRRAFSQPTSRDQWSKSSLEDGAKKDFIKQKINRGEKRKRDRRRTKRQKDRKPEAGGRLRQPRSKSRFYCLVQF